VGSNLQLNKALSVLKLNKVRYNKLKNKVRLTKLFKITVLHNNTQ
jgi:hypothetical protein